LLARYDWPFIYLLRYITRHLAHPTLFIIVKKACTENWCSTVVQVNLVVFDAILGCGESEQISIYRRLYTLFWSRVPAPSNRFFWPFIVADTSINTYWTYCNIVTYDCQTQTIFVPINDVRIRISNVTAAHNLI